MVNLCPLELDRLTHHSIGASYGRIFGRIILPLSLPMIATLGLFQAVGHWNDWFVGAFFVKDPKLQPLQTFLRYALASAGISYTRAYVSDNPELFTQDPRIMAQLKKVPLSLSSKPSSW